MKIAEVPQQAEGSMLKGHQRACYAQAEDGSYRVVGSRGWEVENIVNAEAVAEIRRTVVDAHARVMRGEVSPLAYHMARTQMDVALLAAYTGFWRVRVRYHLRPAVFARLSPALLARYADALGIGVDALKAVPPTP